LIVFDCNGGLTNREREKFGTEHYERTFTHRQKLTTF